MDPSLEIGLNDSTSNQSDYSYDSDYYGGYGDEDYDDEAPGLLYDYLPDHNLATNLVESLVDNLTGNLTGNLIENLALNIEQGDSSAARFIIFVATCLLVALGLPLTLWAICGLYSQVRNGEVAPIYVINLLISDLVQFCYMIVEVAQLKVWDGAQPVDPKIIGVFKHIYIYSLLASVGFMVCIALERYLLIVHPLWYHCRRTIKTSVLLCVLVWILPVVYPITNIVANIVFAIFCLLPFPLLIFFLVATLKALSASISVPTEEKRRIAGMLILVLLIYTLLFLPAIILLLAKQHAQNNSHIENLTHVGPILLKLSPLADLVLYIFTRKGIVDKLLACVRRSRPESNEISMYTVNDDISAEKDGEREGEGAEGEL